MMKEYAKLCAYVLALGVSFSSAALGAPTLPHTIPTPSHSSDPLYALPSCQKREVTISAEALNEQLQSLQPDIASDQALQFAEDILSFQEALPRLLTGSCAAIESDAKPSFTKLESFFKDYLSRNAMITWKYESGLFELLKKNGARSRITCRLADKPKGGLPVPSGTIKPFWEYCCSVELCVGKLKL